MADSEDIAEGPVLSSEQQAEADFITEGQTPPSEQQAEARPLPVLGFDLDDTLWDTSRTLANAHEAMVAATPSLPELQQSAAGIKEAMMVTISENPDRSHDYTFLRKETLRRLLGSDALAEEAFAVWFEKRNDPAFYPNAVKTLQDLRAAGFRLCAISDGNSNPMEMSQLQGLFEFAVNAIEAGATKPDERPFRLAASKAGVPCNDMVYIGDNYSKDVVGAKNVGMRAIWVRTPPPENAAYLLTPSGCPDGDSIADAEVASVAELPQVLRSML